VNRSITIPLLPALLVTILIHAAYADFSFVPGDYYTSNYFSRVITQYDSSGAVVGSTVAGLRWKNLIDAACVF